MNSMNEENEELSTKSAIQPPKRALWDRIYTCEVSSCLSYLIFVGFAVISYFAIMGPLVFGQSTSSKQPEKVLQSQDYTSSIHSLGLITAIGVVTGHIVQLMSLPSLLGMLLTGILLRNFAGSIVIVSVIKEWSVVLRRIAFVVILLRGGLSLDADAVRRLKGACLRLSIIPCSAEIFTIAIAAKIILGMDMIFGIALGAVLGAVSPAVVIPALLEAHKSGYGVRAGVPSLVIAAASLDDVFAITVFSLTLSLIFPSGDSPLLAVLGAPAEVFTGIFFGTAIGFIFHFVPRKNVQNLHLVRFALLFAFSLAFLFGTTGLRIDGAGAIGVLVAAFIAGHAWKKEGELPEEDYLAIMWHHAFQPLLFGLIGLELNFEMINLRTVLLGVIILAIGLAFRLLASFCAVFGSGLTVRERFFVAIAWVPKATVQAALAPVVLEAAQSRALPRRYIESGSFILTIAILSILITAPFGALAIRLSTPVLLKKDRRSTESLPANNNDFEMTP